MKIKCFKIGYRFRPGPKISDFTGYWTDSPAKTLRGAMADCRRRFSDDPEVQPWFVLLVGVVDSDGLGPWIVASCTNSRGGRWCTVRKSSGCTIQFEMV